MPNCFPLNQFSAMFTNVFTAVLLYELPISLYFIWYVYAANLIVGWDWLWAILFTMFAGGFCIGVMTYVVFASRKTKWPFAPVEMQRFRVKEKLQQRGVIIDTDPNKPAKGPIANFQKLQKIARPDDR